MKRTTTRTAGAVVLAGALALTGCAEEEPAEQPVVEEGDVEVGEEGDIDVGEDPAVEEPVPPADVVETSDIEVTAEITGGDDATADS